MRENDRPYDAEFLLAAHQATVEHQRRHNFGAIELSSARTGGDSTQPQQLRKSMLQRERQLQQLHYCTKLSIVAKSLELSHGHYVQDDTWKEINANAPDIKNGAGSKCEK
jgi:hypothetical protein